MRVRTVGDRTVQTGCAWLPLTVRTVSGARASRLRPPWIGSWLPHLLCVTCGNPTLLFLCFLICDMGIPAVVGIKYDNIQTVLDK